MVTPKSLSILLIVDEDVPVGTLVGNLSTKDPDTWQSHRYRLLRTALVPPPLYIDQADTPWACVRTNATLDYDAVALYPVCGPRARADWPSFLLL